MIERLPLLKLLFAFAALLAAASTCPAEEQVKGAVDQLVALNFSPTSVYLLYGGQNGELRRAAGAAVASTQAGGGGQDATGVSLVGAFVPLPMRSQERELSFCFFLKGRDQSFAATPVKSWGFAKAIENAKSEEVLKVETEEAARSLALSKQGLAEVERKLHQLRDSAAKIAEIDQIIDLKMELNRLKSFGQETDIDLARLKELIRLGRRLEEHPDALARRLFLAEQLRRAAIATSSAELLSRKKQLAASASLAEKVALIKETSGKNAEELAQEVLKLRARRKELEQQLKLKSSEENPDF